MINFFEFQGIKKGKLLCSKFGYLDVDLETLQHKKYLGLGDNICSPLTKTAAATAVQTRVVETNLKRMMVSRSADCPYEGYTSCPLVTGRNKGILAEFNSKGEILETFPFMSQDKESFLWYFLKAHVLPFLYWNCLIKGTWKGPKALRKLFKSDFS